MDDRNRGHLTKDGIRIYEPADFAGMRVAGELAARILDEIAEHVVPGVTTGKLDEIITNKVETAGAKSATIGYKGYQHASCISVNHVVCHGIPGKKVLKDGDILNIDVTVIVDGWFGDTSRMYFVGEPKQRAKRLVDVTYEATKLGIQMVKPGVTLGDIGAAIQAHAYKNRYSVVYEYCGHGIGQTFHEDPQVLHYGRAGTGLKLEQGMTFTIEPMINIGKRHSKLLNDEWTVVTKDRSLSAQWEHTIAVTEDGYDVLTESPNFPL